MRYKCPKHPDKETLMTMDTFKKHGSCQYCSRGMMSRVEIKEMVEARGYKWISCDGLKSNSKVKYICPKHSEEIRETVINNFKRGAGCKDCGYEIAAAKNRLVTIKEIRQQFRERGYELLETKYKSNSTKMRFLCPHHPGKIPEITYTAFKAGTGCIYCVKDKQRGEGHPRWKGGTKEIKAFFRSSVVSWTKKVLVEHDYRCFITNEKHCKLEVHHTKPFHELIEEVMSVVGVTEYKELREYAKTESQLLRREFHKRHSRVVGLPLRKDLHKKFHSLYGKKGTIENLYEFKERYWAGEFERIEQKREQLKLII